MKTTIRIRPLLQGLLVVMLLSGQAMASPGDAGASGSAPSTRESPYARYAREHAKAVEKKPTRVKPTPSMNRHPTRGSTAAARH